MQSKSDLGGYFIHNICITQNRKEVMQMLIKDKELTFEYRYNSGKVAYELTYDVLLSLLGYDSAKELGLLPQYVLYLKSSGHIR